MYVSLGDSHNIRYLLYPLSFTGTLRKGQEPGRVPRLPAPRHVGQDAGGRHRRFSHSGQGDQKVAQEGGDDAFQCCRELAVT